MRFKIISVKDNSVRVNSGIVTFDVKVINDECGNSKIQVPRTLFISDTEAFITLTAEVKKAYFNSIRGDNSNAITSTKEER